MSSVEAITIETSESTSAGFYEDALGLGSRVRTRHAEGPASGFRGFLLGLVLRQPADVDEIIRIAVTSGATSVKPAAKSLWGYGGVIQAPDGTIVTLASSSKKDSAPASAEVQEIGLQLGVADVPPAGGSTRTTASRWARATEGSTLSSTPGRSRSP